MSDDSSGRLPPRLGFTSLIAQKPYFCQFESSRNVRPEASFRTDADGLCLISLKAIAVDSINICGEQFKSQRVDDNRVAIPRQYPWPNGDIVPLMRQWRELAYEHCAVASSPYGTTEGAIKEAFWRTLIADSGPDPSKPGRKADFECERGYNRLFRQLMRMNIFRILETMRLLSTMPQYFHNSRTTHNRRSLGLHIFQILAGAPDS
jgi:hypothetical protein